MPHVDPKILDNTYSNGVIFNNWLVSIEEEYKNINFDDLLKRKLRKLMLTIRRDEDKLITHAAEDLQFNKILVERQNKILDILNKQLAELKTLSINESRLGIHINNTEELINSYQGSLKIDSEWIDDNKYKKPTKETTIKKILTDIWKLMGNRKIPVHDQIDVILSLYYLYGKFDIKSQINTDSRDLIPEQKEKINFTKLAHQKFRRRLHTLHNKLMR